MSDAEVTDGKPEDINDVPVASQEEYAKKTQNEKWVYLPDGEMRMRVREMPPFYFLARLQKYGVDITETAEKAPEDISEIDAEDVDADEVADSLGELDDVMGLMAELAEQVVEPTATWAEDGEDPDAFDLSTLSDEDVGALMAGIMGDDGEVSPKSFPDG
jgi:hypothetical protein